MNEERLESPRRFAEQLGRHLARFAVPAAPLPSDAELTELVEATFFASLREEEARHTSFSVAWQPAARECVAVVAITTPVRVTPRNLSKLAPATRHEATSIAVRRDGAELVAWALLERTSTAHQPLTIRTFATGVLHVEYGGVARALYARGEIRLLGGDHAVRSPARCLSGAFTSWSAGSGIDPRADAVMRIAERALDHGHGGMILVLPAAQDAARGVRAHYELAEGERLLSQRYAEADAIDLVARLTAIDNALLIDTDLRIRGFGVQVIEADAPEMTFEHVNPYTGDSHVDDITTFKGTRHPAGVIFCMRQDREAAAIIASQDGHLSLAVKDTRGRVQVLGSYEHAFGWLE